ncbi:MAG TPA: hypothetical protein VK817_23375 [Trebonia sp.]|nr:hypothetical protein [Trebonia sp.]
MSQKTTLIVFTSPAEGREDEYNEWYDNTHLPEFLALPGVVSGKRYRLSPGGPKARQSYTAVYELDGPASGVLKAMDAAIKDGSMHMSSALDPASISMSAWEEI